VNRLLISTLLLSCSILISCAGIERGPLERFQQPNVESAKILEQSLSDSEWLYSWRGNQYNFRFNSDGSKWQRRSCAGGRTLKDAIELQFRRFYLFY